jgi:hypothetical protein
VWLLWVPGRRSLPLEQTSRAVEFSDGIDISDEVIVSGDCPCELDLQISPRLDDLHTIVLAEPRQEHDSLPQHAIPGVAF